jgi:2-C-methyl-D-erythritol 4-phosphate cytidylyltransferase
MTRFAVILPAAGASRRFGPQANKLFAPLKDGLPVVACTLQQFLARTDVELVVIATPAGGFRSSEDHPALTRALGDTRVRTCEGGTSRADSVRKALAEVPDGVEWVAVHDAARPLVSAAMIERAIEAAERYGAAVPALPIVPTVKQADGPLPAKVLRTVPRQTLWAVQTPQVMRRAALEAAFAACPVPLEQVTDEAQLLELSGQDVWLVQGDERNLKITTPDDLHAARAYLDQAGDAAR